MRKSRLDKLEYKREEDERRLRIEQELVQEARGNHVIDVDAVDMQTQIAISRLMKELDLWREVDRNAGRNSGSSTASRCGKSGPIEKYLRRKNTADKSTVVSEGYQERIDVAFDKTKVARIGEAWARFFHANAIPGRKANCPYFRAALLLSMELGVVHPLPKGSDIDGKYLTANRMELEEYVMQFKDDWKQFGVTIMCDSWTGPTSMSIINFMVYCNEKMLFHKSVNASGKIQNADFLYLEIKKVIVDEIGHEVVMQIVTDNGSNYKKACALLIAEYPHIYWQPCAAHTINLMLKDIAKFPDVAKVVKSAKKICRFLHSHNRLHEEMRAKVGGELIRPNATRFGTVFIFLQSFFDKKDKFREWMVSALWKNSEWNTEPRFDYVENCITSSQWWSNLKGVIDAVEPLYKVLRYADQQKHGTVAGFQLRMTHALHLMEAYLGPGTEEFNKYMSKVIPRVQYLYTDTLMEAAAVLDPEGHYKFKSSQAVNAADKLKRVIAQLADSSEEAMVAMKQFLDFRANKGTFNGTMARLAASNTSPSDWWLLYGGEVPILQKYALRIVSQCVSSSGCERNWSTFALIHTS